MVSGQFSPVGQGLPCRSSGGGREGCVVTPVVERYDPGLGGSGRVILKSISADYLARKGGTDDH